MYAYTGDSPTNFSDPFGLQSTLTGPPTVTQPYPGTPSPGEVAEGLDSVEAATAGEEAGAAAAAGGGAAAAATAGVAGVDVALGWYDYIEFRKLCDASGWSWCNNPVPQPSPSPSPDAGSGSGSMAGRNCSGDDERCRKVREECHEQCWEEVRSMPVLPQDRPGLLRRCTRQCMAEQGCDNY